jgi:UDP-GlcNAc:undecaprenyl-phosphate GlcNAc-1-phosphate transferase
MLWVTGLVSVLVAFVVTRVTIDLSLRGGVLDVPNARSSHTHPMPRLGGLGIVAAVAVSAILYTALATRGWVGSSLFTHQIIVLLAAGLGLAATGLYDDLYRLRPSVKLVWQIVFAGLVVVFGYRIESASIIGWGSIDLGWVSVPVTILWLTGFANIFNFMDGINGISAGTGIAYFLFVSAFAWFAGSPGLGALAIIFAGSCLGFLPHNFPVARTFMGDTGSLFLGIVLATYVVYLTQRVPDLLVPLLLVCSTYLWDSGFTLLRRLKRGENVFQAHRSHLYQRLVQAGRSHVTITTLYFILHVLMGCLALACYSLEGALRAGVLALAGLALAAFTLGVYGVEQRAAKAQDPQREGAAGSST